MEQTIRHAVARPFGLATGLTGASLVAALGAGANALRTAWRHHQRAARDREALDAMDPRQRRDVGLGPSPWAGADPWRETLGAWRSRGHAWMSATDLPWRGP